MSTSNEVAAQKIKDAIVSRYKKADGDIDLASVFNALGALAGFGCQMAVWEGFVKPGKIPKEKAFQIVETKDGQKYYFGDFLNTPLFGDGKSISVWSLVAGAAQKLDVIPKIDLQELAKHTVSSVGTPEFGVPRVPNEYRPRERPLDALKFEWAPMRSLLEANKIDPRFWGWAFALAAQFLILENAKRFEPMMAVQIVMETAVPMSKIDPAIVVTAEQSSSLIEKL